MTVSDIPNTTRRGNRLYWRPTRPMVRAGVKSSPVRLSGYVGDDMHEVRAKEAATLEQKAQRAISGGIVSPAGTWGWLIERYLNDEFSPIHDVKANTRAGYAQQLAIWSNAIGHLPVAAMTYIEAKTIKAAMEQKGRSLSHIKRQFTMLKIVANYGAVIPQVSKAALEVIIALKRVKTRTPVARSAAITEAQIRAIIQEAQSRGLHGFALGVSLQWWLGLRAVDVRGQWLPVEGPEAGGIVRRSGSDWVRWQDGLTWDMVSDDLTTIRKTISKTEGRDAAAKSFDLSSLPEVRAMLAAMPNKVGPIILGANGDPYTLYTYSQTFRRLRDALKMPKTLWLMDIRAGAITDARLKGASLEEMRELATHQSATTTTRYARSGDQVRANVVKLRKGT